MKLLTNPPKTDWARIFARPTLEFANLFDQVNAILTEVKQHGDAALLSLTEKFDGVRPESILVSQDRIKNAETQISDELKTAIANAAGNIRRFHEAQWEKSLPIETSPGVTCWRKSIAIEKVGLYIPGGSAPLFSTVLMLGIPAKIAGCKEITLCTPPDKSGNIHPAILYAASFIGISRIGCIGGAQAIGALAFGTETIPAVDKIFGPGNQYVTAAKQLISLSNIAIDMPAGPSEVAVVADSTAIPAFIAADLLSQAEHGPDSQVILFCTDQAIINGVQQEIEKQLATLPRQIQAIASLAHSTLIFVDSITSAMDMCNYYAPEHLIIASDNAVEIAELVINAGSVFMGNYTPEAAGDYASGTNHTLPTNGTARAYSGISLDSFLKKVTFQSISKIGIETIGDTIEIMAEAEMLQGHSNAVKIRRKSNQQ